MRHFGRRGLDISIFAFFGGRDIAVLMYTAPNGCMGSICDRRRFAPAVFPRMMGADLL